MYIEHTVRPLLSTQCKNRVEKKAKFKIVQCAVCSVQCAVCSVQYALCCVRFEMVRCAVRSVQFQIVQCAVWRPQGRSGILV